MSVAFETSSLAHRAPTQCVQLSLNMPPEYRSMELPTSVFLTPSRGFCVAYAVVFQTAPTHGIVRIRRRFPYGYRWLFGLSTSCRGLGRMFQRPTLSVCRVLAVVFSTYPGQSPGLHSRPLTHDSLDCRVSAGRRPFHGWTSVLICMTVAVILSGVAPTAASWTF